MSVLLTFSSAAVLVFLPSLTITTGHIKDVRVTSLTVPSHVTRGETVKLECRHNLPPGDLYSIKWYRDDREFFRYMPSFENQKETFPMPGINTDADRSTGDAVYLKSVDLDSSGRYKCEVISEAPDYHTADKSAPLMVVELPKEKPTILGIRHHYRIGDEAKLTCISAKSRPSADLTWTINGKEVPEHYVSRLSSSIHADGLEQTREQLRFRINRSHFIKGEMNLTCSARISSVYHRSQQHYVEGHLTYNIPVMESRGVGLFPGLSTSLGVVVALLILRQNLLGGPLLPLAGDDQLLR